MKSTSFSMPKIKSSISFSVSVGKLTLTDGRLTPFLSLSSPLLTAFLGDGQVITGESQKVLTEVMPPFTKSKVRVTAKKGDNQSVKLAGKEYNNGISFESFLIGQDGFANFNLEGKYTNLTGLLGLDEAEHEVKVDFVGDGKLLKSFTIIGGQLPVDVNLDVTGVRLLEIKFEKTGGTRDYYNHTNFVDIMVK